MSKTVSKAVAVTSSVLLLGAGSLAAAPILANAAPDMAAASSNISTDSPNSKDQTRGINGSFSYSQAVVSSNESIANVFSKAAASLCISLPAYAASMTPGVSVNFGPAGEHFSASIGEMADESDADTMLMGCACVGNTAGGGAIMNANVSGVSVASLIAMMGA